MDEQESHENKVGADEAQCRDSLPLQHGASSHSIVPSEDAVADSDDADLASTSLASPNLANIHDENRQDGASEVTSKSEPIAEQSHDSIGPSPPAAMSTDFHTESDYSSHSINVPSTDAVTNSADADLASTSLASPNLANVHDENRQDGASEVKSESEPIVEQIDDSIGPSPHATMSTDLHTKSDLSNQIKSKDRPEIIDGNEGLDHAASDMVFDSLQDSSTAKKNAQSATGFALESFDIVMPSVPSIRAVQQDNDASRDDMTTDNVDVPEGATLSIEESIMICRSRASGTWFIRESSKNGDRMASSPAVSQRQLRRARKWGGCWLPVTLRQNEAENWQKLKNYDFYLIPSGEGITMDVPYIDTADGQFEDEESFQVEEDANLSRQDSTPVIPEAFLVTENDKDSDAKFVTAEPLLPLWKQPRMVVSVICLMLVAAAAVAFPVAYVIDDRESDFTTPSESDFTTPSETDLVTSPSSLIRSPPSPSPSLSPSSSFPPSSTLAPSVSPTTCFWVVIDVTLTNNNYASRWAWKLSKLNYLGGIEEIDSYKSDNGSASHVASMCLTEGAYEFAIDFAGEGGGEGRYSITSNGQVIARGDELWDQSLAVTSGFSIADVSSSKMLDVSTIVAAPSPPPTTAPI